MVYKKRRVKDSHIGVDILDKVVEYVEERKDEFTDEDGNIDDDALDRVIQEEFDSALIYDADVWEIMAHYQRPQEADYDSAIEDAFYDVDSAVRDKF